MHHVHHDMRQQRRHQGQAQLRLRAQRSVAYVDTTGSSVTTLLASSPTSKVPDPSWSELLLLELANQLVHSVPTVRIVHTSVLSDQ